MGPPVQVLDTLRCSNQIQLDGKLDQSNLTSRLGLDH